MMKLVQVKRQPRQAARRGISTIEVAVSTLLVGFLSIAAMKSVGGVLLTQSGTDRVYMRAALAQALLSEIAQSRYEDEGATILMGPELLETTSPATRSQFDDVDDYHGWADSPPKPKDSSTALSGFAGWSRSVQVVFAEPAAPLTNSLLDKGLKRITVTVTDPAGRQSTHTAFRSRWGGLLPIPDMSTTVRSQVITEIRTGSGASLYGGTDIINHARDVGP